jgi:type I restriction enzyme S subunit
LVDLVKIAKGKKHSEVDDSTQRRYLQIEDLTDNLNKKYTPENGIEVKPNDVIIAWDGANAGKVGTGLDGVIGSTLARLRVNEKDVIGAFLFRFLDSQFEKIKSQRTGATIPHVSKDALLKLEIPLPPLPVQQKIAAILDKADSLRQKDKQLLKLYDDLAQSVFYEMFGDPVKNERGWNKMKFEDVVAKDCPLTYGIVQPGEEFPNGIPVVRPVDLEKKYITKEELKKIDPIISNKFKRTLLKGNELLLSVRGSVGLMSYATSELIGSNVTRGIVPIWMDKSKANNFFICALFKNPGFLDLVKRMAKGATLIQINLSDLREMMLIVPPLELQSKFDSHIKNIENQLIQADKTHQRSEALFQSLLQRAFNGKLVKD